MAHAISVYGDVGRSITGAKPFMRPVTRLIYRRDAGYHTSQKFASVFFLNRKINDNEINETLFVNYVLGRAYVCMYLLTSRHEGQRKVVCAALVNRHKYVGK